MSVGWLALQLKNMLPYCSSFPSLAGLENSGSCVLLAVSLTTPRVEVRRGIAKREEGLVIAMADLFKHVAIRSSRRPGSSGQRW